LQVFYDWPIFPLAEFFGALNRKFRFIDPFDLKTLTYSIFPGLPPIKATPAKKSCHALSKVVSLE
jgi:hypothetical protein